MTTGVTIGEREPDRSSGSQPSDHSPRPVLRLAEDPAPLHAGPSRRRANPQPPHLWLRKLWNKDQLHFSEQGLPPASLHPRFLPLQHHHRSDCTSQHQDILCCSFSFFSLFFSIIYRTVQNKMFGKYMCHLRKKILAVDVEHMSLICLLVDNVDCLFRLNAIWQNLDVGSCQNW